MKIRISVWLFVIVMIISGCKTRMKTEYTGSSLNGAIVYSDDSVSLIRIIQSAQDFSVQHLVLSGELINRLSDLRDSVCSANIQRWIGMAKQRGINAVSLSHDLLSPDDDYPASVKLNDSLIAFSQKEFWTWLRNEYSDLLKHCNSADGFVVNMFNARNPLLLQYSVNNIAMLVDSVTTYLSAGLTKKVILRLNYSSPDERQMALKVLRSVSVSQLIVIEREVPGKSFLTFPVSEIASKIPFPVLIEFDCIHTNSGQGVLASIFPSVMLKRLRYYQTLSNVIGYMAMVDRPGSSGIIGTPASLNLYTLKAGWDDREAGVDKILDQYITTYYGLNAIPHLKPVFKSAVEIIQSSLYTLGIPSCVNSSFDFEYEPNYSVNIPGRWMDVPVVVIRHGVNKEFNYWSDVIQHLAPARYKMDNALMAKEVALVKRKRWVDSTSQINIEYLNYIVKEKNYAVQLSEEAMNKIVGAKQIIADSVAFATLYQMFYRTYLTTKLYRSAAKAYFGYRIYFSNETFRNPGLKATIAEGLTELRDVLAIMRIYPYKGIAGEYNWANDIVTGSEYYKKITRTGWAEYGPAMAIDDEY